MCVDGLTKGMADRSPLNKLMKGSWQLKHAAESFVEPRITCWCVVMDDGEFYAYL